MLYSHGNYAKQKESVMSIFKSVVAVLEVHAANNKAAKRRAEEQRIKDKKDECIDKYDKDVMSYYTHVDSLLIHVRKQPLGFAEITVSHKRGVEVSRMVKTPRQYMNIRAAYDNGVYADALKDMFKEIETYVQKEITLSK